jgi:hypothetical protein
LGFCAARRAAKASATMARSDAIWLSDLKK